MSFLKKTKGFTLIELLLVILILALITTLVMASFKDAKKKGNDARRISDLEAICKALELYYNDYNHYPYVGCSYSGQSVSAHFGVYRDNIDDNNIIFDVLQPFLSPDYMSNVPNDLSAREDGNWSYFYDNYYDSVSPEYTPETKSCTNQAFQLLGYLEDTSLVNQPADFPWGTWGGRGWWRACKNW